TGTEAGKPWNVIVLNDNHNTFQGVAFALSSTIPGVDYDKGMRMADRIHNSGRAVVWSGHKEPAELYWEQLRGFGLTMAPVAPAAGAGRSPPGSPRACASSSRRLAKCCAPLRGSKACSPSSTPSSPRRTGSAT